MMCGSERSKVGIKHAQIDDDKNLNKDDSKRVQCSTFNIQC